VVVPVIKKTFLGSLLKNIRANTVQPKEVLIIDNGNGVAEEICCSFDDLPIRYLKQDKNIGVNASWNLGLKESKTELISILNDDLTIPECFFSLLQDTFKSFPLAGFVVPYAVPHPTKAISHKSVPSVALLPRREGWAFTVRKSLLGPIPSSMFTFFGDDWFFHQVASKRYWALKIMNSYIYHHVGISGNLKERKDLGLPEIDHDRKAWIQQQKTFGVNNG
jgi:glycosyltransferase involved in cell wall biosynthesis